EALTLNSLAAQLPFLSRSERSTKNRRTWKKRASKDALCIRADGTRTERWPMIDTSNPAKSIFVEAIEKLAPERWPAFLDESCANDPALRAQVERLLDAQAQLGAFRESPSLGMIAVIDPPITERPGMLIGPYKLL